MDFLSMLTGSPAFQLGMMGDEPAMKGPALPGAPQAHVRPHARLAPDDYGRAGRFRPRRSASKGFLGTTADCAADASCTADGNDAVQPNTGHAQSDRNSTKPHASRNA